MWKEYLYFGLDGLRVFRAAPIRFFVLIVGGAVINTWLKLMTIVGG